MNNKDDSVLHERLFFIVLAIFCITTYIPTTMFTISGIVIKILNIIIYLALILKMFVFSKYNLLEYILGIFSLFLFLMVLYESRISEPLLLLVMIYLAQDIKFEKILKWYSIIMFFAISITVICAKLDIIRNLYFMNRGDGTIRQALGSVYPTNFAAHVFFLLLAHAVYRKFNLNIVNIMAYIAIVVGLKFYCDARLDIYLILAIVIISIFKKYILKILNKGNVNRNAILVVILTLVYIFSGIFSMYGYNRFNNTYILLDKILSNRLSQGNLATNLYKIKIFGQKIDMVGSGGLEGSIGIIRKNYFYIDNSFLRILLVFGLITFILILAVLLRKLYSFYIEKKFSLVIACILVVISSSIDQHLFDSYNIFILVLMSNTDFYRNDIVNNI